MPSAGAKLDRSFGRFCKAPFDGPPPTAEFSGAELTRKADAGFDVLDLESFPFPAELEIADAVKLAIVKHAAVDERGVEGAVRAFFVVRDAVIHEEGTLAPHPLRGGQ